MQSRSNKEVVHVSFRSIKLLYITQFLALRLTDYGAVRLLTISAGIHCARMENIVHTLTNFSRFIQIPPNEQGLCWPSLLCRLL